MTTTDPAPAPTKPLAGCAGDGCLARNPWPLHHVRHRGVFSRLCTSCVLKCHPGSFCCLCFSVLDPSASPSPDPAPAQAAVVHCSKCPSVTHLSCLPNPDLASQFVCPCCDHQDGFSFFALTEDRGRRRIDMAAARVLLAAARLAAGSMSRAAAAAVGEAERKAKEAAVARKRARDMLESAMAVARRERERARVILESTVTVTKRDRARMRDSAVAVLEPPKKKVATGVANNGAAETPKPTPTPMPLSLRRPNNREVDKWMRFHEMGTHVVDVTSTSRVGNAKEPEEKGKKGPSSVLQGKAKGTAEGETEKGPRLPPSTQDAQSSRTNSKVIFTGSTSTATLHS
ncbi:skin secretory protein xP2 [Iris pallida]|uniref:Skin secretory protein xP2 n=1 Tax=Iris pallida TaxID=29817 RepID=A0AAX6DIK1_IRIPA|nr:skin secretory protein xP2 [Iris pallida]